MRTVDAILQNWRTRMARPWIRPGARVLDIGCHQGEFLESMSQNIGPSLGYDPLTQPRETAQFRLVPATFREPMPHPDESFDAIVMLATLEHILDKQPLARECFRLLSPGGRLIITVPTQFVDSIIDLLRRLHLADGMSLDEHHGYDPRQTPQIFGQHGFELEHRTRFQAGLNFLFVLKKPARSSEPSSN